MWSSVYLQNFIVELLQLKIRFPVFSMTFLQRSCWSSRKADTRSTAWFWMAEQKQPQKNSYTWCLKYITPLLFISTSCHPSLCQEHVWTPCVSVFLHATSVPCDNFLSLSCKRFLWNIQPRGPMNLFCHRSGSWPRLASQNTLPATAYKLSNARRNPLGTERKSLSSWSCKFIVACIFYDVKETCTIVKLAKRKAEPTDRELAEDKTTPAWSTPNSWTCNTSFSFT